MATYRVIGVGEHKKYFDEDSYHSVINYIFSHAKSIGGNTHSAETSADEMLYVANQFHKNSGKRLRHSVLSFSKKERVTANLANNYAIGIKEFYADEFQIVYAVHNNTDEVHIHFVMNQISYIDGHRYAGKKQDYYAFKQFVQNIIERPVILVKGEPETEG